jgi:hypothetical protein
MLVDPDGRHFEDPDDEIRANKSMDQATISIEELKINKYGRDNSKYSDLTDEAKAYQVEYCYKTPEQQAKFNKHLNKDVNGNIINVFKGVRDIVPNNLVKTKDFNDIYPRLVTKHR